MKAGRKLPEWVFTTPEGTPLDGDNVRHGVFYRLLESAKRRRIRIHDLRHTFASQLIQNGEPLTFVKEQMGHSSIQVTVDSTATSCRAPIVRPWTHSTRILHASQAHPTTKKRSELLTVSN